MVPRPNGTSYVGIGLPIYLLVGIPELLLWQVSSATLTTQLYKPHTSRAYFPLFPCIFLLMFTPISHTPIFTNQPLSAFLPSLL